jgi:hypothetical protein
VTIFPRFWPLPIRRRWFQRENGTFYRNCPTIMAEQKQAIQACRFILAARLSSEWGQAFRVGLITKDHLDRGDLLVEPLPFREAYPDEPSLWVLDDPAPSEKRKRS